MGLPYRWLMTRYFLPSARIVVLTSEIYLASLESEVEEHSKKERRINHWLIGSIGILLDREERKEKNSLRKRKGNRGNNTNGVE